MNVVMQGKDAQKLLQPVITKTSLPLLRVSHIKRHIKVGTKRYKTCENALLQLIWKDFQPVNIVESPAFLNYCKTLDPLYHPKSRIHFSHAAIPRTYEKVKEMVMMSAHNAEYISFTTDLWTGCHSRAYMSIIIIMLIHHHCVTTQKVTV